MLIKPGVKRTSSFSNTSQVSSASRVSIAFIGTKPPFIKDTVYSNSPKIRTHFLLLFNKHLTVSWLSFRNRRHQGGIPSKRIKTKQNKCMSLSAKGSTPGSYSSYSRCRKIGRRGAVMSLLLLGVCRRRFRWLKLLWVAFLVWCSSSWCRNEYLWTWFVILLRVRLVNFTSLRFIILKANRTLKNNTSSGWRLFNKKKFRQIATWQWKPCKANVSRNFCAVNQAKKFAAIS